jgi:transmembrane sensor
MSSDVDNGQIIDEASEWFVTLRDPGVDAGTRERFMEWLRRSPEHVQAYLDTVVLWGDVAAIGKSPETSTDALIQRARVQGNIVPLASAPPPRSASTDEPDAPTSAAASGKAPGGLAGPAGRRGGRRVGFAMAASSALLLVGLGALALWNHSRALDYETGIGEQRTLRLSDGSRVELNSRSRILVRFSDKQRAIELVSGQALFEVAKDPQRAFLVSSDAVRVRALGTRFDVNQRRDGTVVTVVEGRVAVADHARESFAEPPPPATGSDPAGSAKLAGSEVLLSAGQQVTVQRAAADSPRAVLSAKSANPAAVTAWLRGELVFHSEPLSSVVDEFNRYNARRIVLEDSVEDFPVTATFATTGSDALVKFLAAQPDLQVDVVDSEVRIRTAGGGSAQK